MGRLRSEAAKSYWRCLNHTQRDYTGFPRLFRGRGAGRERHRRGRLPRWKHVQRLRAEQRIDRSRLATMRETGRYRQAIIATIWQEAVPRAAPRDRKTRPGSGKKEIDHEPAREASCRIPTCPQRL